MIKKCDDKWCLYNKAGTKLLGKHSSKEDAEKQERAIEANKGYQLKGVEIFAVGEHNGDKYSHKDLDDMVTAYNELDFDPAIKLGHTNAAGAPAFGYLSNLRKQGDKLLADIVHLSKEVYENVREKRFGRVSAEVYWNFKRAGKVYRRVIGALALLGQEIPGVSGLKPLYKQFNVDYDNSLVLEDSVRNYEFNYNHEDLNMDELKELKARIDALENEKKDYADKVTSLEADNKRLQEQGRQEIISRKIDGVDVPALRPYFRTLYNQALRTEETVKFYNAEDKKTEEKKFSEVVDDLVLAVNKQAASLFKEQSKKTDEKTGGQYADAAAEVDKRVKEYQEKHYEADYEMAFSYVMENDAELAAAYNGI